jgi:Ca-activated chloride channel family protein
MSASRTAPHRRRVLLHWLAAAALLGALALARLTLADDLAAGLAGHDLRLAEPDALWALLLLPLLVGLRGHFPTELPWPQRLLSLGVKLALVLLLTAALADVRHVTREADAVATVYVVDVSASIPDEQLARARAHLEATLAAAAGTDAEDRAQVRVVTFAETATELPLGPPASPGGPPTVPPWPRPEAPDGMPGTDIAAGLRLGVALLPAGRGGRLVVVTDGHETAVSLPDGRARAASSLLTELPTLARLGVPLDYLTPGDIPPRPELVVTGLSLPDDPVKPNVPFSVGVGLTTTVPTTVTCEVTAGQPGATDPATGPGTTVKETRTLSPGDHTLAVELRVPPGPDRPLAAACTVADAATDAFATNNRYATELRVAQKPRVLYLEGEPELAGHLAAALGDDFALERRGPRGTPTTLAEARRHDLIVFSDIPRVSDAGLENVTTAQMGTLEAYVRDGGGLLVLGGENALGPGGYGRTRLEREVLPVRLDVAKKQENPEVALVIAIDRSGSMSGPKMDLARQAAAETVNTLEPSDYLGVFPFDNRAEPLVPLQRAANRFRISEGLAQLKPGGGTNILAGLDAAISALMKVDARLRHVILVTDGQSSRAGVIELATQAALDRITVSTIAIGQGSDTQLLRQIAEAAGGRYHFTEDPRQIPLLFMKETRELTRRAIVDARFAPKVAARFRDLQAFSGLDFSRAPPLLGYVATRAKPGAEVLMTTHLGEPLLARSRLGLGRVAVWTSDVKPRWSQLWLAWPGYAKLWRQLARDLARTEPPEQTLPLTARVVGRTLQIGLDAIDEGDQLLDGLAHAVTVTDPTGTTHPVTLTQVAAGRYEGRFAMRHFGPHRVAGQHTLPQASPASDAPEVRTSAATAVWPYPAELAVRPPDLTRLSDMAARTGGTADPAPETLVTPRPVTAGREAPLWPALPPWMVVLAVLDVVLRRVRLARSRPDFV